MAKPPNIVHISDGGHMTSKFEDTVKNLLRMPHNPNKGLGEKDTSESRGKTKTTNKMVRTQKTNASSVRTKESFESASRPLEYAQEVFWLSCPQRRMNTEDLKRLQSQGLNLAYPVNALTHNM